MPKQKITLTAKIAIFSVFLFSICIASVAEDSEALWVEEVNFKSDEGKDLTMKFEEIERQEYFSIVRVKYTSGASVPSIMFMVKGFYNIAKIREKKYFINLKEWQDQNDHWMYKVGFVNSKDVDLKQLYGNDIKAYFNADDFFSVEKYELFWGQNRMLTN